MDLTDSPREAEFRSSLRTWLENVVKEMGGKPNPADWLARRAYDTAWQRQLFDQGYAGASWPGSDRTPAEQLIIVEELERAHAPYVGVNFVGLLHAGPTIAAVGNQEQKDRYLPTILSGDEIWCQGFSEPDAGSDLASLRTTAVREGDNYLVNGSKIWTSHAEVAQLCELLVRTGEPGSRSKGITWLIMEMDSPGIEIRPLRTMTGSEEFAELYLEDVLVPVSNRVGDEGDGWRVAMVTFGFERGTAFVGELIQSMEVLRTLKSKSRKDRVDGEESLPNLDMEIGAIGAELDALWALVRRNVSSDDRTSYGSVFKLAFSELRQRLGELATQILGPAHALAWDFDEEMIDLWMNSFSRTIAAGTSQIQRNIIGERILGLPK